MSIIVPVISVPFLSASKHPLVPDSILVSSFSPNLLLIFLFCNLLTGAVNMSIDTVQQSALTSLIILIAYTLLLCFIALGLHFHGDKLKFRWWIKKGVLNSLWGSIDLAHWSCVLVTFLFKWVFSKNTCGSCVPGEMCIKLKQTVTEEGTRLKICW